MSLLSASAVEVLRNNLWQGADEGLSVWALLDGHWAPDLCKHLLESGLEFCSLFEGPLTQARILDSPYLVRLEPDHSFTNWLLTEGWGKGWGVYFQASVQHARHLYAPGPSQHVARRRAKGEFFGSDGLENDEETIALLLRKHFRHFTRVEFEDEGRIVAFRFFDPAVLRIYLSHCIAEELDAFFGPVRFFLAEHYNEIESLNKPHEMILLSRGTAAAADEGESRQLPKLRAQLFDLQQMEVVPIVFPEVRAGAASRSSVYTMIRHGHLEAFKEEEAGKFREEVVLSLMNDTTSSEPLDRQQAEAAAARQIPRAQAFGLRSRFDLLNFVVCTVHFGPQFPDGHQEAQETFKALREEAVVDNNILSDRLTIWANSHNRGA